MMIRLRAAGFIYWICGLAAACCATTAQAYNPVAGDFSKANANQVRVLSYNTQQQFIADSSTDAPYQRVLRAIHPDVIVFQEIAGSVSASTLAARLNSYFPGETWSVHLGLVGSGQTTIRNALCSRFGLSMQITDSIPASDTGARGLTAALVDLPDAVWGTQNLYMMGVHWKSGGESGDHQRRQVQADAAVNWMRDARTPGGYINLPAQTAMIIAGDMNLAFQGGGDDPPYHASTTIIDGGIYYTGTYGQPSPPDWDGTALTDSAPYDPNTGDPDTHNSTASSPYSRHDRIIYTDSVIRVANRFVLSTRRMNSGALSSAGLQTNDTSNAADHLPIIADFAPGTEAAEGKLLINEFSYDDVSTDDRTFVELINTGGQPINLDAPKDYWFVRTTNNAATSPPGASNQSARTDLKGVIPPGGLFVFYSSGADSTGVAAQIAGSLPTLQRQAISGFTLPNGPDVVMGIIEQRAISIPGKQDFAVEAYVYRDSSGGAAHYLLTSNTVPLMIQAQGNQISDFNTATDDTFSRLRGDTTLNTFAEWQIPDTATPGLPNNTALTRADAEAAWALYP